jgi:hypothetical protein
MVVLTYLLTSFGAAFDVFLTLSRDGKRRMRPDGQGRPVAAVIDET